MALSLEIGAVLLGFAMLAKGAHWLVDGGASLAERSGASPLLVGLTVVAWGTSMPEVVVSSLAAMRGQPGMSLGNVLGSNVANIGLVLGASALLLPLILLGRIALRELVWLLGSLVLLWAVCFDRSVSRFESVGLLLAFGLYNFVLLREPRTASADFEQHHARHPLVLVLVGSVGIFGGAHMVMYGAEGLALRAGLSQTVIGLTVLAIGTSLPELAAGISSAMKGHGEIGLGNVVGSNVFNSLAVIGIAGLIAPFGGTPEVEREMAQALGRDFPTNLGFALGLLALPFVLRGKYGRWKAAILLGGYGVYLAVVFYTGRV